MPLLHIFATSITFVHLANTISLKEKNSIVASVMTDVCLVPPTLSMQAEGFHIEVATTFILAISD
jgi:hypothetical protein